MLLVLPYELGDFWFLESNTCDGELIEVEYIMNVSLTRIL